MNRAAESTISRRAILNFLYQYRPRLIAGFLVPLLLFILIAIVYTPRYQAETVLIIRLGAEYVYQPEGVNYQSNNNNPIPLNPLQIFKSETAILDSQDLHTDVIKALGIKTIFPEMFEFSLWTWCREGLDRLLVAAGIADPPTKAEQERRLLAKAAEKFEKRLDITLEKESAVITLTFENKDGAVALKTLNTLLAMYFEKRRTIYLDPRAELAEKAMLTSLERVRQAERELASFKHLHGLHALDDQREALLARRDRAEEQATLLNNSGLEGRIASYNRQLEQLDALEREFDLKQKELDIARESYTLYSHKYNEAKAFEELEHQKIDSVRVAEQPTLPAEPRKWRLVILLCGFFTSVLSAGVVAVWTHFIHNGFQHEADIRDFLGSRLLGTLKYKPEEHISLIPLQASLSLARNDQESTIIAFMSARSGEGTSYTAFHYARMLAQPARRRILLIDAGKFSAHNYDSYPFIPPAGIAEARTLEQALHFVHTHLAITRLTTSNDSHFTITSMIQDTALWQALRTQFDTIIIDAGSPHTLPEAFELAAVADRTLIVVEADRTPKPVVKSLYDRLTAAGISIEGVMLNKKRHYIPERVYRKL